MATYGLQQVTKLTEAIVTDYPGVHDQAQIRMKLAGLGINFDEYTTRDATFTITLLDILKSLDAQERVDDLCKALQPHRSALADAYRALNATAQQMAGPTLLFPRSGRGTVLGYRRAMTPASLAEPKRTRVRTVDDSARDYVTTTGAAADLLGLVDEFSVSELASPLDEQSFLAGLEGFIRTELTKSRDEHFVELSMKLASVTEANIAAPLYRNFTAALVSFGQEQKLSEVSDLQALQHSLIDHGKLVMLAPPGSGKTTLLHHLTLKYIGDYRSGDSLFLPIFVPLAMYIRERGTSIYPPAAEWIKRFVATIVPEDNFVHREFDKLARAGRFIFILDGLDQLPDRRSQLARLDDLKRMESKVQRLALLAKVVRFAGRQDAVPLLEEQQQAAAREREEKESLDTEKDLTARREARR